MGVSSMGDILPTLALGQPAVDVSAGIHACAVLLDGTLKCWGYNNYGQLGLGDTNSRINPTTVGLGTGMIAKDVEAGTDETCVIMVSGQVKCWGRDYRGVLGNPDSGSYSDYFGNQAGETADALPFIDFGPNRTAVSLSLNSTACATLTDATTVCWGEGLQGQRNRNNRAREEDAPIGRDGFADDMGDGSSTAALEQQAAAFWWTLAQVSVEQPTSPRCRDVERLVLPGRHRVLGSVGLGQ